MLARAQRLDDMLVEEFLAWNPGDGQAWQLVDGEPHAMAPASVTHGALQIELGRLIGNHLAAGPGTCRVVGAPGIIPKVQASRNMRVPDLAVTCAPYDAEQVGLSEPVLIVEILSPSNRAETWANVWTYTTIPSVQEILVLHSERIMAQVLRRMPDGGWPHDPDAVKDGELVLASIGFSAPLAAIYRTTRLGALDQKVP